MSNWWDGSSRERYWCEVTDRTDIGSDLKAPQKNEAGQDYWSYSLMKYVVPGDVVLHYSTRQKAFVGASVAGGPMEERPIVLGTARYGRTRQELGATGTPWLLAPAVWISPGNAAAAIEWHRLHCRSAVAKKLDRGAQPH
jgi:hypothetical protein